MNDEAEMHNRKTFRRFNLIVKLGNDERFFLPVTTETKIREVKDTLNSKCGFPTEQMRIIIGGYLQKDDVRMGDLFITADANTIACLLLPRELLDQRVAQQKSSSGPCLTM